MSKQTFDFSEALRRMKKGKKVKRRDITELYIVKDDRILVGYGGMDIEKYDNKYFPFDSYDILATDWEEVEV